ncbi:MAG: hypothetical protein BWY85_00611 [Firmicutes bacterium ADurb.Bin506]|nr:MAG: hypothetical protein BWY85_00611 [Firmicutes bacterium ADurb.Bin506]
MPDFGFRLVKQLCPGLFGREACYTFEFLLLQPIERLRLCLSLIYLSLALFERALFLL